MEGRHIPGFYYDPERKKYFRVIPNHLAPSGVKYSKGSIKEAEREGEKRKRSIHLKETRERQLVQRSKILSSPSAAQICLDREHGGSWPKDARAQAIAGGLESRVLLNFSSSVRSSLIGLGLLSGTETEILSFDYDPATQGLLLGYAMQANHVNNLVSVLPQLTNSMNSIRPTTTHLTYSMNNSRTITAFRSEISSVNLGPSRTLITTTTGSAHPPTIHITNLLEPEDVNPRMPIDTGVSTVLRPPDLATIWTSAPNRCSSGDHMLENSQTPSDTIAIGTSNGIISLTRSWSGWESSMPLKTQSDVLALDWLSPRVLAAGLRDASIFLWDARSQGSAVRLRHNSTVSALRRADGESRIVVCGLSNSLAMYDLRMVREGITDAEEASLLQKGGHPEPTQKRKRKRKGRQDGSARQVSTPVLTFDYSNAYRYPLGFDVSAELGLVAAAQDDGTIRMYSLQTGEKIGWAGAVPQAAQEASQVKCLRFVDDGRGVPKVMASIGASIVEYAW